MSEQSSHSDKVMQAMGLIDKIFELQPDLFKGIKLYGSFNNEEYAEEYLRKLGINSVSGKVIDKIFVKNILDQNLFVAENRQLEGEVSLWSLLVSSAEVAKQLGLREIDDYKAGLVMKFDNENWICLRLDYVNPMSTGSEGIDEFEVVADSTRYEVAITSRPDLVDWMAYDLYE